MAHASTAHAHSDAHGKNSHAGGHHVVSWQLNLAILVILLFLTLVTVAVTLVDLGASANLAIALLVAVAKAALVLLYFMHLRWDAPFNAVALIGSMLFVMLFIVVAIMDTDQNMRNLTPPEGFQSSMSK
jgi:cytochrome c oxidase subunit IV